MTSSLTLTLGLIAILVGLIYTFLVWNFSYWKKRGVRGPKPIPFFGNFPNMVKQKQNFAIDMQEIYKQFHHDEDFVGVFSVRTPQLMVLNPELVQKVLVTDFSKFHDNEVSTMFDHNKDKILSNNLFMLRGEKWKDQRKELVPGFTANRIKAIYPVTQEICRNLTDFIKNHSKEVDAKDLCLRYTCDVVTDCALGVKANSLSEDPTPILKWTKTLFQLSFISTAYAFAVSLWPTIKSVFQVKFFQDDTTDFFYDLVTSAVELRRRGKGNPGRIDFVNFMLQLQEKKHLSHEQVFSHSMTFLLDGFETTASVIASCLYQLAKNPLCQEKLLKEVESNLNDEGLLEFEKLSNMSYIDQCIHESIRIIPPLLFGTKLCTQPCELIGKNGNKVQLQRNESVVIPFYAFHHDEQFYPKPNQFIPERFDPENGGHKKFRDIGAFFGFSDGPRICLGMRFALVQTKAALAEIVKSFNVKLNPKTRTDNRISPTEFLGALDGGVWLDFEERK